jgi:hypothetical protein
VLVLSLTRVPLDKNPPFKSFLERHSNTGQNEINPAERLHPTTPLPKHTYNDTKQNADDLAFRRPGGFLGPGAKPYHNPDTESILNHPPSRFMANSAWSHHVGLSHIDQASSYKGPIQGKSGDARQDNGDLRSRHFAVDEELEAIYDGPESTPSHQKHDIFYQQNKINQYHNPNATNDADLSVTQEPAAMPPPAPHPLPQRTYFGDQNSIDINSHSGHPGPILEKSAYNSSQQVFEKPNVSPTKISISKPKNQEVAASGHGRNTSRSPNRQLRYSMPTESTRADLNESRKAGEDAGLGGSRGPSGFYETRLEAAKRRWDPHQREDETWNLRRSQRYDLIGNKVPSHELNVGGEDFSNTTMQDLIVSIKRIAECNEDVKHVSIGCMY